MSPTKSKFIDYLPGDRHSEPLRMVQDLEKMRQYAGPPNEFWPAFLEHAVRLAGAKMGLLMFRDAADAAWKTLCVWPNGNLGALKSDGLAPRIEEIAQVSVREGHVWESILAQDKTGAEKLALGIRLDLAEAQRASAVVFLFDDRFELSPDEVVIRLKLATEVPAVYQLGRMVHQAKLDVASFSEALDLMVLINEEKRYVGAAMTYCNEIAARYKCERTSLGWLKGAYVRLQAVSHMERFEKKWMPSRSSKLPWRRPLTRMRRSCGRARKTVYS